MWFDVKAALLEIEGTTPANLAKPANQGGKTTQNEGGLAGLAGLAAPKCDISFSVNTADIEFEEREAIIANNGTPEEWVSGHATLVSLPYPGALNRSTQHFNL